MYFKIPDTPDTDSVWDRMGNEWQLKANGTEKVWKCVGRGWDVRSWVGLLREFGPLEDTPPGSIVMADRSVAINKIGIAFYFGDSCLPTWDALQRYVRCEPIRVVRVGWSS